MASSLFFHGAFGILTVWLILKLAQYRRLIRRSQGILQAATTQTEPIWVMDPMVFWREFSQVLGLKFEGSISTSKALEKIPVKQVVALHQRCGIVEVQCSRDEEGVPQVVLNVDRMDDGIQPVFKHISIQIQKRRA